MIGTARQFGKLMLTNDADGFDALVLWRYNKVVRRLAQELAVPLVEVHGNRDGCLQ